MSSSITPRIKPPALRPGDTVGIVAPASNVKRDDLEAGCDRLRRAGYQPLYFDSILEQDLYFAGSVERRTRELQEMFAREEVRAIICARGGYGANYLLPALDLEQIKASPKIFVGYSDLTALLTYFADAAGMVTFHGPMVAKDWAREGGVDLTSWQAALAGAAAWELELGAVWCEGTGGRRGRGNSLRRMPLDTGGFAGNALRDSHGRNDSVSRRSGGEALSDRPHADAVEAGGEVGRGAGNRVRRNARLRADCESGLYAAKKS